jgi:quinol monooxygenase YgiN
MAITRINEFQVKPDKASALRDFLRSVIARIIDAPGSHSCELLLQHDDPTRLAIIEVWDSVEAHQAAVSRIPPGLFQQAQTLFAVPARGAYYDRVSEEAPPLKRGPLGSAGESQA